MKSSKAMNDYIIQITHTIKSKKREVVEVGIEECRAYTEAAAVENVLKAVRAGFLNNPSHTFTAKCLGLAETTPRIDSSTLGSKGVRPYNAKAESMRKQNKSKKLLKQQDNGMDQD